MVEYFDLNFFMCVPKYYLFGLITIEGYLTIRLLV